MGKCLKKRKRYKERKHPGSSYWISKLPRKKELRKEREVNNQRGKRFFPEPKYWNLPNERAPSADSK